MKENDVQEIYLAHCTSDIVCQEFKKQIPDRVHIIKTGMIYEFDKEKDIDNVEER